MKNQLSSLAKQASDLASDSSSKELYSVLKTLEQATPVVTLSLVLL